MHENGKNRYLIGSRSVFTAFALAAALGLPDAACAQKAREDGGKPTQETAEPADVRAFVTQNHIHGVPYSKARAYGPSAIPLLVPMLKNRDLQENWVDVVTTMGFVGDGSATAPLLAFLRRQRGEITVAMFRAVLSVYPSLGHIAGNGDKDALNTLLEAADPRKLKSQGFLFGYSAYRGDALVHQLSRMAVQGLGISGRPEALARLEQLGADPVLSPTMGDIIEEAIRLNQQVQAAGAASVFGEER